MSGYTDAINPCQGVKGFTEVDRDRCVTDAEFRAVWDKADPTLRDAMDIALLTGQRPADVLKIQRDDIRDGALFVAQNKTGTKRAIEIVGELATVIERITSRPRVRRSTFLIPRRRRHTPEPAGAARPLRQGAKSRRRGLPIP